MWFLSERIVESCREVRPDASERRIRTLGETWNFVGGVIGNWG